MSDTRMKYIIESMEELRMDQRMVDEMHAAGIVVPLVALGQDESRGASEDDEEVLDIEEGLSQGAIDRMVDAMVSSPRVERLMSMFGLDPDAGERLRPNLASMLKMFFSSEGMGVSGAASAKSAIRAMGR